MIRPLGCPSRHWSTFGILFVNNLYSVLTMTHDWWSICTWGTLPRQHTRWTGKCSCVDFLEHVYSAITRPGNWWPIWLVWNQWCTTCASTRASHIQDPFQILTLVLFALRLSMITFDLNQVMGKISSLGKNSTWYPLGLNFRHFIVNRKVLGMHTTCVPNGHASLQRLSSKALWYSDVLHGSDLIEAFRDGRIREDDITILFSIDGAQLYAKKASSCWIYIWVLLNLTLARRYKKKSMFLSMALFLGLTIWRTQTRSCFLVCSIWWAYRKKG
jgi:hypothetical protein